ncbi:hypothetical protein JW933_08140 [candidate division FCPU426 bacterium]|nr:hypothetical protein [candidate division FCPU426 bacterium]
MKTIFGRMEVAAKNIADALLRPDLLFAGLAESQDLHVAWTVLGATTLFFSLTSVLAHFCRIPYSAEPILAVPAYRLIQAGLMPLILGAGWLACAAAALGLNTFLRGRGGWRRTLAVSAPAFFVPLWLTSWPTELALSLGLLSAQAEGFPGLWVRHLMPACTFLYTLAMLWLAFWQSFRLLVREAFALAVLSLLPALGLFALLLR